MKRPERMPQGICKGCGEEGPLPPFGEGLCFLCATDGPPGGHTQAIGAVAEDVDARHAPEIEESELQQEVREIFSEASAQRVVSKWCDLRADIAAEFEELTTPTPAIPARRIRGQGRPDAMTWEQELAAAGMCRCGRIPRTGRKLCDRCADKARAKAKRYYHSKESISAVKARQKTMAPVLPSADKLLDFVLVEDGAHAC